MAFEALRATLDLVLPVQCAGCALPGRSWCAGCRMALSGAARPARPDPTPADFPSTWAVAAYEGSVRGALIAHKEQGVRALRKPLAHALACAVRAALADLPAGVGPVLVVPVPSRRSAVRARGEDSILRLARTAARVLRRGGVDVRAARALTVAPDVRDQSGLDADSRLANLSGAMRVRRGVRLEDLSGADVVVVDDLVTTGASLAEAARTLHDAGARLVGAAVVAATTRRTAGVSLPPGRD